MTFENIVAKWKIAYNELFPLDTMFNAEASAGICMWEINLFHMQTYFDIFAPKTYETIVTKTEIAHHDFNS